MCKSSEKIRKLPPDNGQEVIFGGEMCKDDFVWSYKDLPSDIYYYKYKNKMFFV
jgi:hypothetical protein